MKFEMLMTTILIQQLNLLNVANVSLNASKQAFSQKLVGVDKFGKEQEYVVLVRNEYLGNVGPTLSLRSLFGVPLDLLPQIGYIQILLFNYLLFLNKNLACTLIFGLVRLHLLPRLS
jgi:hypothetical protein